MIEATLDLAEEMMPEDEARLQQMEEELAAQAAEKKTRIEALAAAKYNELEYRKRMRTALEEEWIAAEYAYNGEYTKSQAAELTGTRVFKNITRAKTDAFAAHVADMLMPTDDKCYSIAPTPKPTLSMAATDKAVVGETPEGNPVQMRDIANGIQDAAEAAAKAMELLVDDQLAQCKYNAEFRKAIYYGAKRGTIIMRGPTRAAAKRLEWRKEGGVWVMAPNIETNQPAFEAVDPFHFYPDPVAKKIEDSEENFETFFWTSARLRAMAKSGFDAQVIDDALNSEQSPTPPQWRTSIDSIGATNQSAGSMKGLYEVWRWQGFLQGTEAVDFFGDAAMEHETFPAVLWGIGPHVIRAELTPDEVGEMPYSVAQVIRSDSSIFGHGIPWGGRNAQESLNAAWRMVIDNGAASAVPSAIIAREYIQPADGNFELRPKKIWYAKRPDLNADVPDARAAIQYLDFPVKLDQLLAIEARCREQFDDEVNFSLVMQGDTGQYTPETAQGTQILYNAGRTSLRALIKDIDDCITVPNITRLYNWNMAHSDDESVKGDLQVIAKGSAVLMERQEQFQMINTLWNVLLDPRFEHKIDLDQALELHLKNARLKDVLLTPEKSEAKKQEISQRPPQQPPVDPARMMLAEVAQGRLQLDAQKAQEELAIERAYAEAAFRELGITREQAAQRFGLEKMKLDSTNQRFNVESAMKAQTGQGI